MKKQIFLIGGAPLTGKTVLAQKLSKKLGIPWISTDAIRGWMKRILTKENCPNLFNFYKTSAENYYKKFSINDAIKHEKQRDKEVWRGVKKFIELNIHGEEEKWDSFIVEGISLHPKFLKEFKEKGIKIVFLIDKDEQRIRNLVFKRGLWGNAKKYSKWVKELEIKYLIKTNEYYLKEAKKYRFKYFIIKEDRKKTFKEVENFLLK